MRSSSALLRRAKNIKLLGMDVDGVLTAGDVVVLESGEEVKFWNSRDRLGLAMVRDHKIPLVLAWITGRESKAVTAAADDLGVPHVVQGCHEKRKALEKILRVKNLSLSEAAYIGDDILDLSVLTHVGFSACPQDADSEVKKRVHYISPYDGGKGAVRDVLEFILRAQNRWSGILRSFLK